MPQEESPVGFLPPFVRLRTVPEMSKVAANLVVARNAISEIRKIEDVLMDGGVTENDFKVAVNEIVQFANLVHKKASETIAILKVTKMKVQQYKGTL